MTGRELPDLQRVFPGLALFDRVVAENGAVLYDPATQTERVLAAPPPPVLVDRLREMKVAPLSVGRSIIATWEPHQAEIIEAIRELGLERQVTFNKGAIMILPSGVTKATGLLAALNALNLSAHNVVAVGDAENDHAFLSLCGCAAVVANALPAVKAIADVQLTRSHGDGVAELADRMIQEDYGIVPTARHGILLGHDRSAEPVYAEPARGSILIAGPSRSGKSTLATALTERMVDRHYEFCVIDPEGDYLELRHTMCLGSARTPPSVTNMLRLLRDATVNLVINTQSLPLAERRALFSTLLLQTAHLRAQTGRPHWLIVDEAHQVLPADFDGLPDSGMTDLPAAILITIEPQSLFPEALSMVEAVIAVGERPAEIFAAFARARGISPPESVPVPAPGEILCWTWRSGKPPVPVKPVRPLQSHKRHAGKYAEGDVGAERSFYFHGARTSHSIRASNLYQFLDVASRIDDSTWERHLRAGDYSAWFRHIIRDEDLAGEVARIEADRTLSATESRKLINEAVCREYAAPWEA